MTVGRLAHRLTLRDRRACAKPDPPPGRAFVDPPAARAASFLQRAPSRLPTCPPEVRLGACTPLGEPT